MAPEDEVLEFTRSLFRGRPDLSTLTLSTVRRKFLAHTGRNRLRPEEKQALQRLVEEEMLNMQVEDAGSREKLGFAKGKRPPAPRGDPGRKRFRFNSESESTSAPSSPDCLGPPTKDETASEESPRRALKQAAGSVAKQQRHLVAKMESEESSEEEGEEPGRTRKVLKEESSEEGDKVKEQKGRTREEHGPQSKLGANEALPSKKYVREQSEDSEEEPVQRRTKKIGRNRGAKSHQESEESEEEILAKRKENREGHRARSDSPERAAWEGTSSKQKSRAGNLREDLGNIEEKEAASSGEDSEGDEESPVQRKSKDKTQLKGRERQSGSSDSEDSRKSQATADCPTKTDRQGSVIGESDTEREVSDCEAGESPNRGRKNPSSKKGSKKSRTRSCSSSSDGSPESKKAGSDRRGEDHPAVVRLKRYIRACGAYRNYKKLLGSCSSYKECLRVLRSELEALGMKGNPSLEKCRALKEQREEAAEMASLDVANIISSSGRPRRRTAWNPSGETRELYHRTLDSDDEQPRQAPPDWSHMRGIISSDGESN